MRYAELEKPTWHVRHQFAEYVTDDGEHVDAETWESTYHHYEAAELSASATEALGGIADVWQTS